jgi:hypothetical protein
LGSAACGFHASRPPIPREDGHPVHMKTDNHSRGRRPPVGAKRRGGWHCYSDGVVAVNAAWRLRMDSPFRVMR